MRQYTPEQLREMPRGDLREYERELAAESAKRERRADDLIRTLATCVWPECERPPQRFFASKPMALCRMHSFDVWRAWDSLSDRTPLTEYRLNRDLESRRRREREDEDRETRAQTPGWVYYLRMGEQIKIGYSMDVKQRMKAYPPEAELLAVHPGTLTLEATMHERFAAARAAGREWFHQHDDLMAHIADALAQFGDPSRFAHKYREGTAQRVKPKARRARRI